MFSKIFKLDEAVEKADREGKLRTVKIDDDIEKLINAFCEDLEEDDSISVEESKALEELLASIEKTIDVFEKNVSKKYGGKDIKHCPFCGSSAVPEKDENGHWYMTCCYCPIETDPVFDTAEEAIDFWNDREV